MSAKNDEGFKGASVNYQDCFSHPKMVVAISGRQSVLEFLNNSKFYLRLAPNQERHQSHMQRDSGKYHQIIAIKYSILTRIFGIVFSKII